MRRVRTRMYAALDRRTWPRDQMDLYFLLGCLNGLMAVAADSLGHPSAAEELARAGCSYATAIGHKPLLARLRLELAAIAHWAGRPRESLDLAKSGLEYQPDGPNGAALHLQYARAAVRLGDAAQPGRRSQLPIRCGNITTPTISLRLAVNSPSPGPASTTTPVPSRSRYRALRPTRSHCKMQARIDLASSRLSAGHLDAAVAAAAPILAVPPSRRITSLPARFGRVRTELATPRYHGSAQARNFDEQIEQFCRDAIAAP
jgi:hypothetical protein